MRVRKMSEKHEREKRMTRASEKRRWDQIVRTKSEYGLEVNVREESEKGVENELTRNLKRNQVLERENIKKNYF
jgi:hypothetical protein